jgi:hypothetical protein
LKDVLEQAPAGVDVCAIFELVDQVVPRSVFGLEAPLEQPASMSSVELGVGLPPQTIIP